MTPDSSRSILSVESEGGVRLSDVRKFLTEFEDAYNRILVLLRFLDELPRLEHIPGLPIFPRPLVEFGPLAIGVRSDRKPVHFTKSSVASLVGRSELLVLSSVRLESPGSWNFLGVADSLEVLRKYLQDRHERRKDKKYVEATDEDKRRLENELLRTKILSERIKIAKDLGAKDEDLAPVLGQLLYDPLDELAALQDRGLITDVKMQEEDEPKSDEKDRLFPRRNIRLE